MTIECDQESCNKNYGEEALVGGAYIIMVKIFIRQLGKEMICLDDAPVPTSTLARAQWEFDGLAGCWCCLNGLAS
jgi:hypothetical protein